MTTRLWGQLLRLLLLLPVAASADIYVSKVAEGSLLITNLHRVGREYQRIYREPVRPPPRTASASLSVRSWSAEQRPYAKWVASAAAAHGVPVALLHAVIRAESGYNPSALSEKGAAGLMQLMPRTAREMGVANVWDPQANIQGGARYLKQMLALFGNDIPLALAAYNAGPMAVSKRGNVIPPYAQTQRYVPNVMKEYQRLMEHAQE